MSFRGHSGPTLEAVLAEVVMPALDGHGRALFVVSDENRAAELAAAMRKKLPAKFRRVRVVRVSCARASGRVWPLVERRVSRQRRVFSTVTRITFHWLAAAPIIGPIAGAITDSAEALLNKHKPPFLFSTRPTAEAVRSLLVDSVGTPQVIQVEALERADADDLAGLHLFLRGIRETRTLLLLHVTGALAQHSPHLRNLILEAEYNGSARVFSESGSSGGVTGEFSAANLADADRELLALAAVEGAQFHGSVLATLAGRTELDIEDDLARLARAGYIRPVAQPPAEAEKFSRYEFTSPALAQALVASHGGR